MKSYESSASQLALPDRESPLVVAWPTAGNVAGFLEFSQAEDWQAFITSLSLNASVPRPVALKFSRAQKLYLLGWLDFSLIKAGELASLIALELALTDKVGQHFPARKRTFAGMLRHLVAVEGLTDDQIPMIIRCGGTAIGQLTGDSNPTLAQRRNQLAHGDPFEGFPVAGLLELVRDLINYTYRIR